MKSRYSNGVPPSSVRSVSSTASSRQQSSSSCLEKYVEHLHEPGAYNLTSLREERRVARGKRLVRRHILGIWTSILIFASIAAVVVYGIMFGSHKRPTIQNVSSPDPDVIMATKVHSFNFRFLRKLTLSRTAQNDSPVNPQNPRGHLVV